MIDATDTSDSYATPSENLTMKTIIKFIVVIELFVAMAATNEGSSFAIHGIDHRS